MSDEPQCLVFPARGQQCIRYEGHSGPHSPGASPDKFGYYICPVCARIFASHRDFDAHVPCMKP